MLASSDVNFIVTDIILKREVIETKVPLFKYYAYAFKNNIQILYLPQYLHIYK